MTDFDELLSRISIALESSDYEYALVHITELEDVVGELATNQAEGETG